MVGANVATGNWEVRESVTEEGTFKRRLEGDPCGSRE